VYNLSLLGADLFSRLAQLNGDSTLADLARDLVSGACRAQRADGAWPYGSAPEQWWVDNHHTGFNLVALHDYVRRTGDRAWDANIAAGYAFWDGKLMRSDGAPRAFEHRDYPHDIHAAAQAIITYAELGDFDSGALHNAEKVLAWTDRKLRRSDGLYGYQVGRFSRIMIPYFRWGQMWMLCALATLYRAKSRSDGRR